MQKAEQPHDEGSGGKAKEEPVDRSEGLPTHEHSTENGIDSKKQKGKQPHDNVSVGKAKKKLVDRSAGITTYKHSTDNGTKKQKPKQPDYDVSMSKAKKKPVDRLAGIPTYKHSTENGIDFKMPNPVDGYLNHLVKSRKQNVPLKGVSPDGMNKNVVKEAFPRLQIKYTEYIAKFREDIEKSDPDQLLKKFKELESNYDSYKRFVAVPLQCEICDVKTSELEPLFEHYKCSKHKKNLNNPDIKKHIDFNEHLRRVDLMKKIVDMRKKGIYECELCSLTFSKRDRYASHKKGKYHEINLYKSYCAVIIANAIQRTNRVLGL